MNTKRNYLSFIKKINRKRWFILCRRLIEIVKANDRDDRFANLSGSLLDLRSQSHTRNAQEAELRNSSVAVLLERAWLLAPLRASFIAFLCA